jgi:hypothetical protein
MGCLEVKLTPIGGIEVAVYAVCSVNLRPGLNQLFASDGALFTFDELPIYTTEID